MHTNVNPSLRSNSSLPRPRARDALRALGWGCAPPPPSNSIRTTSGAAATSRRQLEMRAAAPPSRTKYTERAHVKPVIHTRSGRDGRRDEDEHQYAIHSEKRAPRDAARRRREFDDARRATAPPPSTQCEERAHGKCALLCAQLALTRSPRSSVVGRGESFLNVSPHAHRGAESRSPTRGAPPLHEQVWRERYMRVQK